MIRATLLPQMVVLNRIRAASKGSCLRLLALSGCALFVAPTACGGASVPSLETTGCHADSDCGDNRVCVMGACVDPLPVDAGGSTGTAGTGVGGSGVYTGGTAGVFTGGTAGAEVGGFAGRPGRGGSGGASAGFGGVAGSTAGAGGASAGAGGVSAGSGGVAGSAGKAGSAGTAGTNAGTGGIGGSSGTSGSAGSGGTDNSVCNTECAAEENYPCAGAPTESACVSQCIVSRAGRAGCLPQDAAFRLCFATQPEICASAGTRSIAGGSCSTESTTLQQCLAN